MSAARTGDCDLAFRWVSCSADVNQTVAFYRHLIGKGPTTLCGATGLGAGVWRGSKTKPQCPACMKAREGRDAR